MTVRELRELLESLPGDAPVVVGMPWDDLFEIDVIEYDRATFLVDNENQVRRGVPAVRIGVD